MRFLRSIYNQEQGLLLIESVLIIFVFASLSIIPVLDFMGTGIVTTKNTGLHTQETYAAEAGAYDGMWKIINIVPELPKSPYDPPLQVSINGSVNGKSVNTTITRSNSLTYRVHSVATNPNTNHQITIDTDMTILEVNGLDLSAFSTFAMTSLGSIETKDSCVVDGDVWIENSDNYSGVPPTGEIINEPVTSWPEADWLETYYTYLVTTSNPYSDGTIDISIPSQSGPLYAQGAGNYVMTGTGNLTGTIYVVGDLYLDHNANISLDGNTIFVTGDVTTHPQALIAGPGGLIALGDISFSPQVTPSFIFIMSVSGNVNFQPQGDFVGAICANQEINLQPNSSVTWEDPGIGNLDLPGLYNHITAINTWTIQ